MGYNFALLIRFYLISPTTQRICNLASNKGLLFKARVLLIFILLHKNSTFCVSRYIFKYFYVLFNTKFYQNLVCIEKE